MKLIYNNKPITSNGLTLNNVWQPLSYYKQLSDAERAALGVTKQTDPVAPTPTLEQVYQSKLNEINNAFESIMSTVKQGVPESEVKSWSKQELDARAYLADNTADVKLLDSLAATRGIPKDIFAQKIIEKSDQYALFVGPVVGKRQILEDSIKAIYDDVNKDEATKIAEINAISW